MKGLGGRFAKSLAAVLLGNLVYFGAMDHLPPDLRHEPFQIDLGLALDALICISFYFVIDLMWRQWSSAG
jgi:hypothetical protein